MKVEILGVGCAKCNKLYDLVTELVKKKGIDAEVVKVEDIKGLRSVRGVHDAGPCRGR